VVAVSLPQNPKTPGHVNLNRNLKNIATLMQAPSFSCNSDIMQLVLSYLPRKMKFTL
jgi:hypothetical protein